MSLIRQNTADTLAVDTNNNNSSPHPGSFAAQVGGISTKPLPPTEKTNDATTARAAIRSAKTTSKNNNVVSFTLKWICMVLTVAAAIVFGIWAPLSYRATADGNRDNNEVQNSMMHQVMTANSIASSALLAASAQCTALESMQDRLNAMGQLAMVDFCMTQIALTACSNYISNVPLYSLMSYLGPSMPSSTISPSLPTSMTITGPAFTNVSAPCVSSSLGELTSMATMSSTPIRPQGIVPSVSSAISSIVAGVNASTSLAGLNPSIASAISSDLAGHTQHTSILTGVTIGTSTLATMSFTPSSTAIPSLTAVTSNTSAISFTPSSTTTVGSTPKTGTSHAANPPHLSVEAFLGVVFGLLTFLGLGAGFFVWRLQKRRVRMIVMD